MAAKNQVKELEIVRFIEKTACLNKDVFLGIGDDAAVVKTQKDKLLVVTTDMTVEGVHFKTGDSLFRIGRKAMGRNISDIAAMGAIPKFAVISAGLPKRFTMNQAKAIFQGINKLARDFNIAIVGGDTTESRNLVINIALLGEAKKQELLRRDTAKPGDLICVTGTLGGSRCFKHFDFMPRVKEARFLTINFKINSMIDVSDGLVLDLSRICKLSKCGAILFGELIPQAKQAQSLEDALYSGEDFELLFTAAEKDVYKISKQFPRHFNTKVSIIGKICPQKTGLKILDKKGKLNKLIVKGYLHFK